MNDRPTSEAATPRPAGGRFARRPTEQARQRRQRRFTWGLSAFLAAMLVNAFIGEEGYLATIRLRRESAALQQELARIRIDSRRLQLEREQLEHDPKAVEEAARRLGMIRDGEVVVTVRDADPRPAPTPSPAPSR
jgi:cell division protein FtsB